MPGRRSELGLGGELDPHAGEPTSVIRADFRVLPINEYLGNRPDELPTVGFPFVGRQSSIKTFRITGVPVDDGYLLLTYNFARGAGHIIKLNGRDLPWVDIFPSSEGSTHLKPIPPGWLVRDLNTLQIVLNGPAILVYYAVVHWRERDYAPNSPPVYA